MLLNISTDTVNVHTSIMILKQCVFAGNKFLEHHPQAFYFLLICSLYNQADVWRADHNPVYEKREGEETSLTRCLERLAAAPYCFTKHGKILKDALALPESQKYSAF